MKKPLSSAESHGAAGLLGPFISRQSHGRVQMAGSHKSQEYLPIETDLPICLTGMESQMAKFSTSIKAPTNMLICSVVPKHNQVVGLLDNKRANECTIIYHDIERNELNYLVLPDTAFHHERFSYTYTNTPIVKNLRSGTFVEKDTVFSTTSAIKEGEFYAGGNRNLNVLFMDRPSGIEDALEITEEACAKFTGMISKKFTYLFNNEWYPMNTHGDINNYRPFLKEGETVDNEDGLLCAFRLYDENNIGADFSPRGLMDIDYDSDMLVYTERGAVVTSINIQQPKSSNNKNIISQEVENAFRELYKPQLDYAERLRAAANDAAKQQKVQFSPELTAMLGDLFRYEEIRNVNNVPHPTHFKHRMSKVESWMIEITVMYKFKPGLTAKLSNNHGAKAVICRVREKNEMPYDDYGNVADIVYSMSSIPARLIPSFQQEQFYNACARDLGIYNRSVYNTENGKQKAEEMTLFVYKYLSPTMFNYFMENPKDLERHVKTTLTGTVHLEVPIGAGLITTEGVIELLKVFPIQRSHINIPLPDGTVVRSELPALIAPVGFMALEKSMTEGTEGQATSVSRTQHHGLPSPISPRFKDSTPTRERASRHTGETEQRQIGAKVGYHAIAEMMDRTNSKLTADELGLAIFRAENPMQVEAPIDRVKNPLGNSITLQMIKSLTDGFCVEIKGENK